MKLISFSRCWIGSALQWLQPDTLGEWFREAWVTDRKTGGGECKWMGVPLNTFNRWPLTLWNLLCSRSAIWTRNTGRGSGCTYISGNRFRHLGWNKTPPTQNPRGWHEAGLGKLKPIPGDGPGCTAAAQAIHPELLVQTMDGKNQSSPLCTSWGHCKAQNTGCVSQDSGLGIQLHSCTGKSIPVERWEANWGPETRKDRDCRGWWHCVVSDGYLFSWSEQDRVSWWGLRPAVGLLGLQVFCCFCRDKSLHQGRV